MEVSVRGWRVGLAVGLAIACGAAGAAAQRFGVDAEPVGGSLSLAWRTSAAGALGVAAGVSLPWTGWTLYPDDGETFEELAHLGVFYRRYVGALEVDAGLRAAVGDLYECRASDCWPGALLGGYVAVFAGWEHVKLGTRLVAGTYDEGGGPRTVLVSVTPLLVRIAFGR